MSEVCDRRRSGMNTAASLQSRFGWLSPEYCPRLVGSLSQHTSMVLFSRSLLHSRSALILNDDTIRQLAEYSLSYVPSQRPSMQISLHDLLNQQPSTTSGPNLQGARKRDITAQTPHLNITSLSAVKRRIKSAKYRGYPIYCSSQQTKKTRSRSL